MRLGSIIYFVPFFFVLNPALIGHGTATEVITVLGTTIIGITFIASALQGYLFHLGALDGNPMGLAARSLWRCPVFFSPSRAVRSRAIRTWNSMWLQS